MSSFHPSPALQRLKKWRNIFGIIVLFIILVIVVKGILFSFSASAPPPDGPPPAHTNEPVLPLLLASASLATSAIALIGFLSTTILAWRKEERELRSFELDNAKKELEIAKLQAELDKVTKLDCAEN